MGPGSPKARAVVRRFASSLAMAAALGAVLVHGQIPGRNVNMVSGTTWPNGDPFLQRQNEPSVAASTRNPLHLLAGSNDYRTVDLPGLPGAEETGDAWLGLYKSVDGGQRWTSTLLPGYPQDPNRSQSVLRHYGTAADPVLRAGTNGLVYYSGLAFNREDNGASAVFVSRFIDNNNREGADPFAYLGTYDRRIGSGDDGPVSRQAVDGGGHPERQRADLPHRHAGGRPDEAGDRAERSGRPRLHRVHVVHAARARRCGPTSCSRIRPIAASGGARRYRLSAERRIAQPGGDHRDRAQHRHRVGGLAAFHAGRFAGHGRDHGDAVGHVRPQIPQRHRGPPSAAGHALARIVDRLMEHRRMRKAVKVEELSEFDQGTSATDLSFRTNAYPVMAWDDRGRLYLAWTERGFSTAPDDQRRRGRCEDRDGHVARRPHLGPPASRLRTATRLGHQFMPSMTFAGGKLMLLYYDLREDVTGFSSKFIDDKTAALVGKRHTMDIRASMADAGVRARVRAVGSRVRLLRRPPAGRAASLAEARAVRTGSHADVRAAAVQPAEPADVQAGHGALHRRLHRHRAGAGVRADRQGQMGVQHVPGFGAGLPRRVERQPRRAAARRRRLDEVHAAHLLREPPGPHGPHLPAGSANEHLRSHEAGGRV